ncbi:MAG: response regulator, partial [Alphaproteobacteria bacterium]|nr:response regulator [Alphaproteobacteria bacterium]
MRLLIVEDSRDLADWLARILRKSNYAVDCMYNAEDAFFMISNSTYDLLIVDLGLPAMGGMELIKKLRQAGKAMPIIILTAIDTVTSRVRGLDLGADDYLVKPFEVSELEARIRVQLRRHGGFSVPQISFGNLTFNMADHTFAISGKELELTAREYAVLEALISRPGRVMQKSALIEQIFGLEDEAAPNALEVYVHRVRKKIEFSDVRILTLRGLGYVLRRTDDAKIS